MEVFSNNGTCGLTLKYTTVLTAATGFSNAVLTPPTNKILHFTGGKTNILAGRTITGATSTATAVIVAVVITGGTLAGSDAIGVLFLESVNGTFQAENIDVGASATECAIAQGVIELPATGLAAKSALISAETAAIQFAQSGVNPTVTAGTSIGHLLPSGSSYVISDMSNMKNFKMINAVASSGAIAKVSVFY